MTRGRTTMSFRAVLVLVLAAELAVPAQAGDYEWVQPPAYTFGRCGGLGDDSVPGFLNQKYYTQHSCRLAFDTRKCDVQADWYQRQFYERGTTECGAWLRQELNNCRRFVRDASENCDKLAR